MNKLLLIIPAAFLVLSWYWLGTHNSESELVKILIFPLLLFALAIFGFAFAPKGTSFFEYLDKKPEKKKAAWEIRRKTEPSPDTERVWAEWRTQQTWYKEEREKQTGEKRQEEAERIAEEERLAEEKRQEEQEENERIAQEQRQVEEERQKEEERLEQEEQRIWDESVKRAIELEHQLIRVKQLNLVKKFVNAISPIDALKYLDQQIWRHLNAEERRIFERLIRSKVPSCEFQTNDLEYLAFCHLRALFYDKMRVFVLKRNSKPALQDLLDSYLEFSGDYCMSENMSDILDDLLADLRLNKAQKPIEALIDEAREKAELRAYEHRLRMGDQVIKSVKQLDELSGQQFEDFLVTFFEVQGFGAKLTPAPHDQGADLILTKNSVKTVVQAKRYNGSVGNAAIQEVVAAIKYYKADVAMVVTTGKFTPSAIKLAKANGVQLVGRTALQEMLSRQIQGRT